MSETKAMDLKNLLEKAGAVNVEIHTRERDGDCSVIAYISGDTEAQVFDKNSDLALCQSELKGIV